MDEFYRFEDENEEMDAILNRAFDHCEQMGGGAANNDSLFKFKMVSAGKRRTWRDVVQRENFNAHLIQLREPIPDDNIGVALTEALYDAIAKELNRQQRPAHHFVNMAITANNFSHAYQTVNFTVGEFLNSSNRLDEMLQKLAGKLNSNEAFNPSQGFSVDVVFVKMPGKGKGRKKKQPWTKVFGQREQKKKMYYYNKQSG